MKDIFVSYRRADSSDVTGRIFDQLKVLFGEKHLFKDVDSIPLGKDFRNEIADAVQKCDVLLAIIGKHWLEQMDESGKRRIDDPSDFVHIEIASALERDIPVIPVLVQGATIPKADDLPPPLRPLAFRNAAKVRADPDFHNDMQRLHAQLTQYIDGGSPESTPVPTETPAAYGGSVDMNTSRDSSNRSVSIGGDATGNVIQTGDHNVASLQFTQATLPPSESVDIKAEFAALRQILDELQAADQKKIDRALQYAEAEIADAEPDKDAVGNALESALKYAQKAERFAATAGKLKTHIANTVSWLGDNWHKLLPLVGLKL